MAVEAPPRPSTAVATRAAAVPTPTPSPGAAAAQTAGQEAQAAGAAANRAGRSETASARPQSRGRTRTATRRPTLPAPGSVSPHTAVVLSMIGTGIVIVAADAVQGHLPKPRSVLGLGVVYIALASLADLAPRLAVPFSALVFTGVLLTKGNTALNGIQNAVASNKPLAPPSYSPTDRAALTQAGTQGFAVTGHPGGPSMNRGSLPPNRQKGNTG